MFSASNELNLENVPIPPSLPPSLFLFKRKPLDPCFLLNLAHSSIRAHIVGDIAKIEDWSGSVSFCNSQGLDLTGQASPTKQSASLGGQLSVHLPPTFLQQTWYDHPNWAVAIFLLVCHKLERVAQAVTHSLRCRVCPKNFGISVIRAVLYDQDSDPRPPIVLAAASCTPPIALLLFLLVAVAVLRRDPPDVVFKREAETMRTHVRQCDSSHSVTW